jgi:SEC-C motif-containing protein
MRSRFTAYVVGDEVYRRRTWHPRTRPARVRIDPGQEWLALRILNTTDGGMFDPEGTVEFRAEYRAAGRVGAMRENSRFVRDTGQWVYVGPVTPAD